MKIYDGNENFEIEGTWREHCCRVQKRFEDHYQNCVEPVIEKWPEWKRKLFGTHASDEDRKQENVQAVELRGISPLAPAISTLRDYRDFDNVLASRLAKKEGES